MAYFTAVLRLDGGKWRAQDVDVEDVDSLDDLATRLRNVAIDEQPVIFVLEREDAWFALVRVDGEEDPRVFISDSVAASSSHYGAALGLEEPEEDEEPEADAGDVDVMSDLGTPPERLEALAGEEAPPTGDALAEVAEAAGFADVLDNLR